MPPRQSLVDYYNELQGQGLLSALLGNLPMPLPMGWIAKESSPFLVNTLAQYYRPILDAIARSKERTRFLWSPADWRRWQGARGVLAERFFRDAASYYTERPFQRGDIIVHPHPQEILSRVPPGDIPPVTSIGGTLSHEGSHALSYDYGLAYTRLQEALAKRLAPYMHPYNAERMTDPEELLAYAVEQGISNLRGKPWPGQPKAAQDRLVELLLKEVFPRMDIRP